MQSITALELASICDATLEGDGARNITGLASLEAAEPGDVSFLANVRYEGALANTRASAVFVGLEQAVERADLVLLRTEDPNRAFTCAIEQFRTPAPRPERGVHASAVIEAGAELGPDVCIGPLCVVGAGAHLGAGVVLHPGVIVGPGSRIGDGSELFSGVVLYYGVTVGERCLLHAGVAIGSDGFGFTPTATGWEKIPQCGSVVIEDDVEIGANTTIDRGRFGATRIGTGCKIDNQVHIAHNVEIGAAALLIAQVGIAGSATIGERVILAGQSGVAGHVTVGAGARIGGGSGVTRDLAPGKDYYGMPAAPKGEVWRQMSVARKLPEMAAELKRLAVRVAELEGERP